MNGRQIGLRVAAAAGLFGIAAAAAPPVAGATTGHAPSVTMSVRSHEPVVTKDVLVAYHDHAYGKARITLRSSGAPAGSEFELSASTFPFKARPSIVGTKPAAGGKAVFVVQPSLETRYRAVLVEAGIVLARATVHTVYVIPGVALSPRVSPQCSRPVCTLSYTLSFVMARSALATELGKHIYVYFALNLSPTQEPPPPKVMDLMTPYFLGTPVKVSPSKYRFSLEFRFRIGNDGYQFAWDLCAKDTVTRDGIGLPGSHGCGAQKVSTNVKYLG